MTMLSIDSRKDSADIAAQIAGTAIPQRLDTRVQRSGNEEARREAGFRASCTAATQSTEKFCSETGSVVQLIVNGPQRGGSVTARPESDVMIMW